MTRSLCRNPFALFFLAVAAVWAQTPDNASLQGRYGFRQIMIQSDAAGAVVEMRSLIGVMTFDGAGSYTFSGQRNAGVAAAQTYSGSGTYRVSSAGAVIINSLLEPAAVMNAYWGPGLITGSTTDSTARIFDIFVAVPLGSATSNASLNGAYLGATLEAPGANYAQLRNSNFRFTANGAGSLGTIDVRGRAANLGLSLPSQSVGPVTYSMAADASGTATFPLSGGLNNDTQILRGSKTIYLSANGEAIIGGSSDPGAHDLFVALRAPAGAPAFNGRYYGAGLRVEGARPESFSGAANALGDGRIVWSRRVRVPEGGVDFSGLNAYTVSADGSGTAQSNYLALAKDGSAFLSTGTGLNFELYIGVRAPSISGSGVFLNPIGVLNAASFAPFTLPVAPGTLLTLFGSNLGPATPVVASTVPFPVELAGTSVSIQGRLAPVYSVSATQVSVLVPFESTPGSTSVFVRSSTGLSNGVETTIAKTAPGIFTQSQSGLGAGAILKANYTLLTPANPAKRGDTILVYLTGLGAVSPAVANGSAAPSEPLSRTVETVNVYVGGKKAVVAYAGLAPGFAGLYQLNVVIPLDVTPSNNTPLAIETSNGFHDMVDVAVVP